MKQLVMPVKHGSIKRQIYVSDVAEVQISRTVVNMIQHPVFLRGLGGGKAMLATVVDVDEIGIPEEHKKDDCFILACTSRTILSNNNPAITLDLSTVHTTPDYMKAMNRADDSIWSDHEIERGTHGMGLGGIMTSSFWFIKKFKSAVEQLMG